MTDKAPPSEMLGLKMLAPASVYVAIRLMSQAIVFGGSLILAGLLPLSAFATIGSAFLVQAMVTPLSGFALHSGLERLFFTYREHARRSKILTVYLASLLTNTAICAAAYLLLTTVLRFEFLTNVQVGIVVLSTLLMSVQYVPIVTMRCEGNLRDFAIMQMVFVVVTQLTILIAVLIERDVEAFFYGTLIGSAAGFVMWSVWLVIRTGGARLISIRNEFRYSIPSVPISALEAVQQVIDRYVLQLAVPGAQFGTYALALRFASPVSTIAQGTKAALYPLLYRLGDERKIAAILSDTTNLSIGLFGVLVNLIIVAMALVVTLFLGPDYRPVFPVFIVIILGVFLRVQEVFLGVGADVTMRQHKKLFTLAPTMVIQIAVSVALTLGFGLWGAAAAFALNGAIRSFAMAVLGQRLLPRRVMLAEYFAILAATVVPIAVYFYRALFMDRMFGPEMVLSLLPIFVLILLAHSKVSASQSSAHKTPS